MDVLPIEYQDYVSVIKMLQASHAESRYSDQPVKVDQAIEHLDKSIEDPDHYVAFKCVNGDVINGVYLAYISTFDFMDVPVGFEWTFYVKPEARGTSAASMLKQAIFKWMDDKQVGRYVSAVHHKNDNSKVYSFNEKSGMKEIGRIFERINPNVR